MRLYLLICLLGISLYLIENEFLFVESFSFDRIEPLCIDLICQLGMIDCDCLLVDVAGIIMQAYMQLQVLKVNENSLICFKHKMITNIYLIELSLYLLIYLLGMSNYLLVDVF